MLEYLENILFILGIILLFYTIPTIILEILYITKGIKFRIMDIIPSIFITLSFMFFFVLIAVAIKAIIKAIIDFCEGR